MLRNLLNANQLINNFYYLPDNNNYKHPNPTGWDTTALLYLRDSNIKNDLIMFSISLDRNNFTSPFKKKRGY